MEKSPDAFRTISEVAEWLDIPTHVLRFWESRFAQIKPVKRAGGRRYYRPSDMRLIGGVKALLHDQGMTIRGVQKMLREQGIKHVSSFSQPLDTELQDDDADVIDITSATPEAQAPETAAPAPVARETHSAEPAPEPAPEPEPETSAEPEDDQPDMFGAPPSVPLPTFIPSRARPAPAEAASEPPAPEPAAAPPEPPAPKIPETPDVPAVDPADDDPGYPEEPTIAARLAIAPAAQLARHRDTLKAARDRLQALLDAQS